MTDCLFATDLHGHIDRYQKLFEAIEHFRPRAVFLGGDLLPHFMVRSDFLEEVIRPGLRDLRERLTETYPLIFVIMGNDDPRTKEEAFREVDNAGLWSYIHNRRHEFDRWVVYGYAFVPPTPFRNKDWEKYDVSRYVPPGAVSPEEGSRTVPVDTGDVRYSTIEADLEALTGAADLSRTVILFHTPPYETTLDRVATDGMMIDHVPLDLHVGSIAVRRFIEKRQPLITLHGHIHESARLMDSWQDQIGHTHLFGAAHDGPELSLVRFSMDDPASAERMFV